MLFRSAHLKIALLIVTAMAWTVHGPVTARAQNPFAPAAPAAQAPAAQAPAVQAPAAAPGAAAPATTVPSAPAANPFAPAAPAPAAPATPAPSAPAANPFAPAAPTTPAPAAPAAGAPSAAPAVPVAPAPAGGYRVLASGVEITITSPVTSDDRVSRHNIVEILADDPNYGVRPTAPNVAPAKNVHFKHDAWGLDFTFKPIRFLHVPGPDGKERRIWYLVYHVKNGPVKRFEGESADRVAVPVNEPFLFIPHFELESHDVKQLYPEHLMPNVVPLIQAREDKNRKLLNTAEITGEIPPSTPEVDHSVWGVATWEGIDPRTDRFSIYVYGLTNAYRWVDPEGAYQKGDPPAKGRTYQTQVLKLNFWRPSDTQDEHEDEIRFGIPGEVDYQWFYK
jgi:hypothetical protein